MHQLWTTQKSLSTTFRSNSHLLPPYRKFLLRFSRERFFFLILTSLIYCLTHNSHAPARDTNIPTIHLATERPRPLTHQLSLDMRRNEPLWLILAWSSSLRIHGHEPYAVNSTCVVSTDVEPCSTLSLKSGISVTPPNLSAVSALRWRNPLTELNVHQHHKLLLVQWVSRA